MADLQRQFRLFSLGEPSKSASVAQAPADLGRSALAEAVRAFSRPILALLARTGEVRVEELLRQLQQENLKIEPSQLLELLDRLRDMGLLQIIKDQPLNFLVKSAL